MPDPDPDLTSATERAAAALRRVVDEWMRRTGVISAEVARRRDDGEPTDQVGIRVTVERKLPRDQVPEGELFPHQLDGIPVDVVEGSRPVPQTDAE